MSSSSSLSQILNGMVGNMPPIATVFMKPDEKIASWLANQLAPDEMIVDCGAGLGYLGARPELEGKVVGIDLRPNFDEQVSQVIPANAIEFEFNDRTVPVFIRPDHMGWVDALLRKHIRTVRRAFYIGLEKNLRQDLPGDGEGYAVHAVEWFDWEGPDGERLWCVTSPDERMYEYVLWRHEEGGDEWALVGGQDMGPSGYSGWRFNEATRFVIENDPERVGFHFVYPGFDCAFVHGAGCEGVEWLETKRPRVRELDSGLSEEKSRRGECLKQIKERGDHWVRVKTPKGRIVEYPSAPMDAWTLDRLRYREEENEEEKQRLNQQRRDVWTNVSPSGLRMMTDFPCHSDLLYCVKVDGEFPEHPMDLWHPFGAFRDVKEALEDAQDIHYRRLRIDPLERDDPESMVERPFVDTYDTRPRTFQKMLTVLCGNPQAVIRGVVSTPRPGERVEPGTIAVCRNGSISYDFAARDSVAMIVGAGGATCHLVTNYRPEGQVIVRFEFWDSLVAGDEVEIDCGNRTVTLITEGPEALKRLRQAQQELIPPKGTQRPKVR